MMRWLFVLALVARAATAAPAIEVGARYVITHVHEETVFPGGALHVASSRGFAGTAEVFWSGYASTQLSATFVQSESILFPAGGGDVDLGTLGLNPIALTARIHLPGRISPFLGAGPAIVVPGNLDDQFGPDIVVQFDRKRTYVAEVGVRYRRSSKVAYELGASYMPLEMDLRVQKNTSAVSLPPTVRINPIVVSIGMSWRF